jgi:hypothetical protein
MPLPASILPRTSIYLFICCSFVSSVAKAVAWIFTAKKSFPDWDNAGILALIIFLRSQKY